MGANVSNEFTQNTVKSLSSVINSTVNSVTQSIGTECTTANTLSALFGIYPTSFSNGQVTATAECLTATFKDINVTQLASGTCSIKGGITTQVQNQLTTTLSNNIQTWIEQNQKQNNGWIAIGLNIAASEQISAQDIANKIANGITNNINQTCSALINSSNVGQVFYCGSYDNINIQQQAIAVNLTTCLTNNLVTLVANDQELNNIVTKVEQQIDQTNEGLSTIAKWLIIAAVILGVLLLIGGLLYLIFSSKSGGQKAPPPKGTQEKMALERRLMEERRIREGRMGEERRMGEGREIGIGERRRLGGDRGMGGEIGERTKFQETEGETSAPKEGLFDRFERLGNRYADLASKYGKYME